MNSGPPYLIEEKRSDALAWLLAVTVLFGVPTFFCGPLVLMGALGAIGSPMMERHPVYMYAFAAFWGSAPFIIGIAIVAGWYCFIAERYKLAKRAALVPPIATAAYLLVVIVFAIVCSILGD